MRILVFTKDYPTARKPTGGIFISRRVEALRALGHELEVVRIVPHAPPIGQKWGGYRSIPELELVGGVPVRTIRAFMPPRMIGMEYLPLQVHGALGREIERFRPDLLNASFIIPCGQIAVRQRVPTVVTAHGSDAYKFPFQRSGLLRAAQEAVRDATRVTAVSGFIASCVQSIAARDVDVIWNGGDERYFYPRDRRSSRERLEIPQERLVIAYAGNLLRAKGLFDLIEAAGAMNDAHRPFLAIAGAGPEREALAELATTRNVEARFFGMLDGVHVGELFGAADIVTLPSYNEGLPNVVCEGMLAGRAVVATSVGGVPEILDDGRTGIITAPGKPEELTRAFVRLASDAQLRERIEAAAREFALEHLTWRIAGAKYERVFSEAVAGTSAAAL